MVIQESPVARDRTCVLREGQARRQREVLVVLHRDVEVVLVERYPARQPVRPVSQRPVTRQQRAKALTAAQGRG